MSRMCGYSSGHRFGVAGVSTVPATDSGLEQQTGDLSGGDGAAAETVTDVEWEKRGGVGARVMSTATSGGGGWSLRRS